MEGLMTLRGLVPETDLTYVYILYDHMGTLIGAYGDAERAVDRAADEVSRFYQYSNVHAEVSDFAIIVSGDLGEITILIEELK